MNNLHLIVSEQFPQFVRSNYPVFVEFVKAYYRWLDTQSVGKYEDLVDIDNTPTTFVKYFSKQLDVFGLTDSAVPFDVKYLKNIKEIYASKGSEEALIYLLRVVSGAETVIRYPSEQILRASDGRWVQEQFITVRTTYGSIPNQITEFYVSRPFSSQRIEATRFEIIDGATVRLYYRHTVNIDAVPGLVIQVRDTAGVIYAGAIIKSPAAIEVRSGGADWSTGQVVIIPGTIKNTIARVAEVDSTGSITRAEIIEYGYDHTEQQNVIASPYPIKPLGSVLDITSVIIGINPTAYQHTLTVGDFTDGCIESVSGISSGTFAGSYFLENYADSDYSGEISFFVNTSNINENESADTSLTIEQWLASRATLVLTYDNKVNLKGRWSDDRGQVSNEQIRLQDNLYYQQYSYVIDSSAAPASYIEIANNIHMAGTKMFTNYSLTTELEFTISAETSFPFVSIDVNEVAETDEDHSSSLTKPFADSINTSDTDYVIAGKYLSDNTSDVTDLKAATTDKYSTDTTSSSDDVLNTPQKNLTDITSLSDTAAKNADKYLSDAAVGADTTYATSSKYLNDATDTATDSPADTFDKYLNDATAAITDSPADTFNKYLNDATAAITDSPADTFNKYLNDEIFLTETLSASSAKYLYLSDNVVASSSDTSSAVINPYASETYFAEQYVVAETSLTLGA